MDWNLTGSTNWDFANLEPEEFKSGGGDFSVDLKLGQVVNGGTEYGGKWSESGGGKSSKRAKRGGDGGLTAACLVDGCRSDLNICRDYHRRHKVCELHSKTPQVSIGGQKQRFCQQCSRFHCLEEFDEGKRSCRKRLDGHNRRRRKPQPESVPGPANIFANYQGTQLLSFSGMNMHDPTHMAVHNLPMPDSLLYNLCRGSPSYLNSKMLQFRNGAFSESGEDRAKILNDRFSTAVRDSDCALSLLSSPRSQSAISLPHHHSIGSELIETVLVPGNGSMMCPGGPSHVGPVGDGPPLTLPFHWS